MSIATRLVLAIVIPSVLVTLGGVVATLRLDATLSLQLATLGLSLLAVTISATVATRRLVSRRLSELTARVRDMDVTRDPAASRRSGGEDSLGEEDSEVELLPGVTARREDDLEALAQALEAAVSEWWTERDVMRQFIERIEDELRATRASLAIESTRAEESDRAKRVFLANISHQLRTPMNGIMGTCEVLLASEIDDPTRECAETIRASSEALMGVLTDVLDYTALIAGDLTIDPIPCDLAATLRGVVDRHARVAREKGIAVRLSYDPVAPRHVLVDAARVRQIVSSLLSNAVTFTDEGSVVVTVSALRVTDTNAQMKISVEDTGIGIEPEDLEGIFESFTQVDDSNTRRHSGTGLGLPMCRALAELMGGHIEVESRPGEGSRFSLLATFRVSEKMPENSFEFASLDGARALFITQDPLARRITGARLERWGTRATLLADADEMVDELRRAREEEDPYEICVVDLLDRDASEVDLARAVSSDPDVGATPLVVLTSRSSRGDAQAMREAGYCGYFVKPVPGDMLHDGLAAVLGWSRSHEPAPACSAGESPVEGPPADESVAFGDIVRGDVTPEGVMGTRLGGEEPDEANGLPRGDAPRSDSTPVDSTPVGPVDDSPEEGRIIHDGATPPEETAPEAPPARIFVTQHSLAEYHNARGKGRSVDATTFEGRALICEDNPVNQMLARRLLEKLGLSVDVAPNGEMAVERATARSYDVIFMDCQMPVMDGIEATQRIRASEGTDRRTPIIAMTANALNAERKRCQTAGMNDFITKPIDVLMLREVLARYLEPIPKDGDGEKSRSAA